MNGNGVASILEGDIIQNLKKLRESGIQV